MSLNFTRVGAIAGRKFASLRREIDAAFPEHAA